MVRIWPIRGGEVKGATANVEPHLDRLGRDVERGVFRGAHRPMVNRIPYPGAAICAQVISNRMGSRSKKTPQINLPTGPHMVFVYRDRPDSGRLRLR